MHHIADASASCAMGRTLQGLTKHPLSFTDTTFDEAAYCRTYQGQRLFEIVLYRGQPPSCIPLRLTRKLAKPPQRAGSHHSAGLQRYESGTSSEPSTRPSSSRRVYGRDLG